MVIFYIGNFFVIAIFYTGKSFCYGNQDLFFCVYKEGVAITGNNRWATPSFYMLII